jgi:hypothetical protein
MKSCIRLNEPTPPINEDNAIISELSGSASSVNKESDVKTVAVSRVLAPLLLAASIENTAKARIGDTIGDMYASVR